PWVSPVHCVPKKDDFTVVANEENELIPTRLVTGWRVCIDYRKLNEATRKDHFPLPFMDQMLERLAGNEYYCFLDGFSGYFQILIDPRDQEKTTFTCPYGTFSYRRMPFSLCNAPGTFQRCMLAIFHDMVEKTMESMGQPVHCVPKKGGFTVVANEENELIPTHLVTGWRVCIDYRKLNEATRKDHFPLPFMDQMLERLAGNEYYCFLDGFSGCISALMRRLLVKAFKPGVNSNWWGISTGIRRSRSSTELFANLLANMRKQSLQGVLNSRRKVGI
nr:reverse transcriptase domain-containing protein [Tanacetum cinerariifolium]